MNPIAPTDDVGVSEELLSKADALIRRNRPDGVSTDAEELPLLTETVEDLPELTDALEVTETPPNTPAVDENETHQAPPAKPDIDLDAIVRAAVEQAQAELLATHERALHEITERLMREAAATQAHASETAHEQGRREAESHQQAMIDEARHDAWQTASMAMSEHLIELDAFIAQSIDQWMSTELPQLLSTEISSMVERVRSRTSSHLRATLLPKLSDKLSSVLDVALAEGTDRP